jgi:hypothetical protein
MSESLMLSTPCLDVEIQALELVDVCKQRDYGFELGNASIPHENVSLGAVFVRYDVDARHWNVALAKPAETIELKMRRSVGGGKKPCWCRSIATISPLTIKAGCMAFLTSLILNMLVTLHPP